MAVVCVLLASGVLRAPDAGAQESSVKRFFEKYNLLGIFAQDCTKPPNAVENSYYVNRLIDPDHVQRDLMESETTRTNVTTIDKAWELGPNEIGVMGMSDNKPTAAIWRLDRNRMVPWEVIHAGEQTISRGKWVKTGTDVPWINRCGDEAPPPQAGGAAPSPPQQSGASGGGCHTDSYTFSTVLSQSATTNSVSTGGAACVYTVGPIHPDQVQFTSASIVEQARNGIFEQTESFAFKYQPNPSFKGVDEYAIKVCGHNNQRAGCAAVTYRVTVK
jgi:hypothetical protein